MPDSLCCLQVDGWPALDYHRLGAHSSRLGQFEVSMSPLRSTIPGLSSWQNGAGAWLAVL